MKFLSLSYFVISFQTDFLEVFEDETMTKEPTPFHVRKISHQIIEECDEIPDTTTTTTTTDTDRFTEESTPDASLSQPGKRNSDEATKSSEKRKIEKPDKPMDVFEKLAKTRKRSKLNRNSSKRTRTSSTHAKRKRISNLSFAEEKKRN